MVHVLSYKLTTQFKRFQQKNSNNHFIKISYFKSVFNILNQFLIDEKANQNKNLRRQFSILIYKMSSIESKFYFFHFCIFKVKLYENNLKDFKF